MLEFTKIAKLPPGMVPLSGEVPRNSKPSSSGATSGAITNSATGSRPTPDEKAQVARMQDSMRVFGESLDKNKDALAAKFKLSVDELERLSGAVRNTGTENGPNSDGKWGRNTQAALDALGKFFSIPVSTLPSGNFTTSTPEEVIALAKKNVDSVVAKMKELGLQVPKDLGGVALPSVFDQIPKTLTESNSDPRLSDSKDFAVTSKDLNNIWSFYSFVSSLGVGNSLANAFQAQASVGKVTLEKVAAQILDSTIVRVAQVSDVTLEDSADDVALEAFQAQKAKERAGAGAAGAGPTQQFLASQKAQEDKAPKAYGGKHLTVAQMTGAIKWFARRANMNLLIIRNSIRSGEEKIDGTPLYTQADLDNAVAYNNSMQAIGEAWFRQYNKYITDGQDPQTTYVDPITLTDQSVKPSHQEQVKQEGLARVRAPGDGGSAKRRDHSAEGFGRKRDITEPPLQYDMDLYDYLHESGSEVAQWILRYMDNKSIRLADFSTRSPENIASMYMSEAARQQYNNDGVFVMNLTDKIGKFLNEVLAVWREQSRTSGMPTSTFRADLFRQNSHLSKWIYALNYLKSRADRWRLQLGGKPLPRRV